MRARLAASADPRRIFVATLRAASGAGLVGAKRVLDSTPLYDAVATMDTITLIRSAIRGLLRVADAELTADLRSVISSGDDYASTAKPHIDWDDASAREALIDSRARDGYACLVVLDGRTLGDEVTQASQLLATVLGQDLETTDDGTFRIARRVAKDRVISTVDPQARHGHKTEARGFDGYKGHAAIDPDSEIITDTGVSAGNVADGAVAADLIDDLTSNDDTTASGEGHNDGEAEATVYGDASYGTGEFLDHLAGNGITARCKTQPATTVEGMFGKDEFLVDLAQDTVTCPNGVTVPIRRHRSGDGLASFGEACRDCPLRAQCTNAKTGRSITVGRHEPHLAKARAQQHDPAWIADYRATRPKIERKLAHLMRHRHGGRRARMRGTTKIAADFNLLAAAQNLARLARLGLRYSFNSWVVAAG